MITSPTTPASFSKELLEFLQSASRGFDQLLHRLEELDDSAVMEWVPGLKYVLTPLDAGYGQVYYLWSGLYMEQGTKAQVLDMFEARMQEHPAYSRLISGLRATPELSRERIAEIRKSFTTLARIMCRLLAGWVMKPQKEQDNRLISSLLEQLETDFLDIDAVLRLLAATGDGLYAFARETDKGIFRIDHAAGKEGQLLLNAVFRQGEGFMGQAILGKEPRHWREISKDPGTLFLPDWAWSLRIIYPAIRFRPAMNSVLCCLQPVRPEAGGKAESGRSR